MALLELTLTAGDLSVRRFAVREAVSSLFSVSLWARSPDPNLDLSAILDEPATFRIIPGYLAVADLGARTWRGIVVVAEQVHALQPAVGQTGLSTYHFRIVPEIFRLTQRRGNRIFQHLSIPDILDKLLAEWAIEKVWQIDRGSYPKLEDKIQCAESDFQFFNRLLEEAGIAFTFPEDQDGKLTLSDRLASNPLRSGLPIPYVDNPSQGAKQEFVTAVRLGREVRPGALAFRDHEFRNPDFALFGEATRAAAPEDRLEQYHFDQGGFLVETGKGGGSPVADDKGIARHDAKYGKGLAERSLHGERVGVRGASFEANTFDLAPGVVFAIDDHPHAELSPARKLLVLETNFEGTTEGEWSLSGHAVFADVPYFPPCRTPKPVVHGLQSATVVGPKGQEIHTDEFGRVRVQFAWDREGKNDDGSSCWVRVNQGWGGMGYGMIVLPRVGQEVLVGFAEGDPDLPFVMGRAYNALQQVPYRLPDHKTRSTWKSDSSLGSGGFNEIMFEDLKGKELVWQQAEKDRTRLVKNDEFATVGHDRQKLVKNDESEHTDGYRKNWVGKDEDQVTKKKKRERVDGDVHLEVSGSRNEQVGGTQSLFVMKDRQEQVSGRYALRANQQVHVVAGKVFVAEGAADVTLAGPGGFLRIDASGVTIEGTLVRINVSGSPGKGRGSKPDGPEEALLFGSAQPQVAESVPTAEFRPHLEAKVERLAERKALIVRAREQLSRLAPGSEDYNKLKNAADRLERNNHAVEMARLSESVYKDTGAPEGWRRVSADEFPGLRNAIWKDKDSGFSAALFKSELDGRYVLAFRGTDEFKDFTKANIPQGLGLETDQYNEAYHLARAVRNELGSNFEVTGHSLGGGLASFASLATDVQGTTFNSAGLNRKTAERVGLDISGAKKLINTLDLAGEMLGTIQSISPAPDAIGNFYSLPASSSMVEKVAQGATRGALVAAFTGGDPMKALLGAAVGAAIAGGKEALNRHGMKQVIEGIETQKKEDESFLKR